MAETILPAFEVANSVMCGIIMVLALLRFQLAMLRRRPDEALKVIENAPQWLVARWEHSVAPMPGRHRTASSDEQV